MAKSKHEIIAALDVGTSKICCFIAAREESGRPRVIGIGHQVSKGIKSGVVVDMEAVELSILNAVHGAEQMAGERIHSVYVNISGGFPKSHKCNVEVSVPGGEVTDHDVQNVMEEGYSPYINGVEHELVHFIPTEFSLDGCHGIRDPRGMYGGKLGANIHSVTAKLSVIRNLKTCIEKCHLDIAEIVVSSYASGLATLVEDELDLGATLIDMGGGVTSIAIFAGNSLLYTDSIPIGGTHVTNDIATCLSTPLSHAERLKTLYGSAVVSPSDETESIDIPMLGDERGDQSNHIPKSMLNSVIQPRLEETFELMRQKLEKSGFYHTTGKRVVLTGGASQLPGVADLATRILDKKVRLGKPLRVSGLAEATGGPAFSTCAGMLNYQMQPKDILHTFANSSQESTSWFGKLSQWLGGL